MEIERIFLIAPILGIELARVKRRVEISGVCIGVAIHRRPGTIQRLLNVINANKSIRLRGDDGGFHRDIN
jgi:hypothetical protein